MALRAEQNPRGEKAVHSPRQGWAQEASTKGSPAPLRTDTLGPSVRQLIQSGPEDRATATIPVGCPLPMGELAEYLEASGQDLACVDCQYLRSIVLAPGGGPPRSDQPAIRYGFCTAPERAPMALVSEEPVESRTRPDTDARVLAAILDGMRSAPAIALATGLKERVVWKAARRLKDEGTLDPGIRLKRAPAT